MFLQQKASFRQASRKARNGPRSNFSNRRRGAISPAPVQIDQNIPRLSAFAGTDNAAILQLIHDARGPRVAQPQSALHERNARLLLASNHFDTLLDERLIFITST